MDTSMGLTPLGGLVMGTRSGDIDPGAVLHLMRTAGYDAGRHGSMLDKQSGLLGLSELVQRCRELETAAADGHAGARLALDVFATDGAPHIGGLAMALRRLDAVVFTGGIGENSSLVRAMTLARLQPFGMKLDVAANERMIRGAGGVMTAPGATPCAAVIPTNEEWLIAQAPPSWPARPAPRPR